MIEVSAHPEGATLPVRVQPRARRTHIVGEHRGALKVAVTEAPERGKANRAVLDLLAEQLSLKKSQLRLIAGETSRDKRFLVVGVRPAELASRLGRLAAGRGLVVP